jgi:hypothetical protein
VRDAETSGRSRCVNEERASQQHRKAGNKKIYEVTTTDHIAIDQKTIPVIRSYIKKK